MDSSNSYITYRPKPVRTSSLTDLTNMTIDNTILDTTMMSLQDSLHENSGILNELTEQNKSLTLQLMSAHQEIENLNNENFHLKSDLQNMIKTKNVYKKLCTTPDKNNITPKRKNKTLLQISNAGCATSNEICKKQHNYHEAFPILKNRETQTSNIFPQNSTIFQNKETQTVPQKLEPETRLKEPAQERKSDLPNVLKLASTSTSNNNNILTEKKALSRKICILSSNNTNRILTIAGNTLGPNTQICHYLKTNCGIKETMNGIELKLQNFTMEDFCIILIGEADFNITNDSINMILAIRESLQKVQHTNDIFCVPTFKCKSYANMYNWRIENFNNLLYLDVMTHEHCYTLDSNKHLTYDHSMFSKTTGAINDLGMYTMFRDIKAQMESIIQYNAGITQNDNCISNEISNQNSILNFDNSWNNTTTPKVLVNSATLTDLNSSSITTNDNDLFRD